MSRIGKLPIEIPSGVEVKIQDNLVTVKGPLGELSQERLPGIQINVDGSQLTVTRDSDKPRARSFHGLMRSLINNMVIGVSQGFSKKLEMIGVGFKAASNGNKLVLNVGFSHPVEIEPPEGIKVAVENNTLLDVSGIDKQLVGKVAAEIRQLRKPEPYKGKGIKYIDEKIIRKAGKAAKVGGA